MYPSYTVLTNFNLEDRSTKTVKTIRIAAISLAFGTCLFAQDAAVLARGKYLVEEVAKCTDCHTAKAATGEPDKTKWLKGGMLSFKPVGEVPKWHATTPDITSTSPLWQRWGMDGMVKFFETAKNPRGGTADPPMPAYTLSHDDAVAIATYLKSLP
jgi:mono/diheme cytochrome c family protein